MDRKSFAYPPGGVLIWLVIYIELFTFGVAILALSYYASQERELFHSHSMLLNRGLASINTIVLLSSGFLIAQAVHFFRKGESEKTSKLMKWAMIIGFTFIILKGIEYYMKLEAGYLPNYGMFFIFYWGLTALHLVHVMVGLVILFFQQRSVKKGTALLHNLETGAAFWHMCDIIWLLLFPVLYLLI